MIDFSTVDGHRRLLLLGEGNFSFTLSLLHRIAKLSSALSPSISVIATCFQKYKSLPSKIQENGRLAAKQGAEVWFGVDAKKVHQHERLKYMQFDYIIFNFPHIDGKMKLHLNRLLLKEFFISASLLLKMNGQIFVTLCKGQSGTCYDSLQRKHEDSWQIIDMALHGDLILTQVHPFLPAEWPLYNSNGFRGRDQSFNTEGASTFIFRKANNQLHIPNSNLNVNQVHCQYVISCLDQKTKEIAEEIPLFEKVLKRKGETFKVCENIDKICLCNKENDRNWIENILVKDDYYDLRSYVMCQPCWKSSLRPVKKMVVINCEIRDDADVFLELVYNYCIQRKELNIINNNAVTTTNYEDNDACSVATTIEIANNIYKHITILYVDAFLQLWANCNVPDVNSPFLLYLKSKFFSAPVYCHDLCFWVPPTFSLKEFSCAIRYAAGDALKSFHLKDDYSCPKKKQRSMCFKMVYQSFSFTFTSQMAFYLQTKVIGPYLESSLNVRIR